MRVRCCPPCWPTAPPVVFIRSSSRPGSCRFLRQPKALWIRPPRSCFPTIGRPDRAHSARLWRIHVVVAIGVLLDLLNRLAGVLRENLLHETLRVQELARLDPDVDRLALSELAPRLVHHDARVRERVPFP